jgi:hypothetical protein
MLGMEYGGRMVQGKIVRVLPEAIREIHLARTPSSFAGAGPLDHAVE